MSINDWLYHRRESSPSDPDVPPIHTVKMLGQPATVFIVVYDAGEFSDRYIEILGVHSTLHNAGKHLTSRILPELIKRLDDLQKSNSHWSNPFDILSDYYIHVFEMNRTESPKKLIELDPGTISRESGFPNFNVYRHHSYVATKQIDWVNKNLGDSIVHQISQIIVVWQVFSSV